VWHCHELAELENVEASGALHRLAMSDLVVLVAVSFRPLPRTLGNVSHDRLRGANELLSAIAMALR
jgi:hypothetical protein